MYFSELVIEAGLGVVYPHATSAYLDSSGDKASGESRVEITRDDFLVRIVPVVRINASDRPTALEELQHRRKDVDENRKDQLKDIYVNIELEIRRELGLLKKDPWVTIRAAGNPYCDIDKIFEEDAHVVRRSRGRDGLILVQRGSRQQICHRAMH